MLLGRVLIALGLALFLMWSYWRGLRICSLTGASRRVFSVLWGAYAYSWYSFLDHKGDEHSAKTMALSTILMCGYMFFYIIRFLINLAKRGGGPKRTLKLGELTEVDRRVLRRQLQEVHA
jgi:hypothetical protein